MKKHLWEEKILVITPKGISILDPFTEIENESWLHDTLGTWTTKNEDINLFYSTKSDPLRLRFASTIQAQEVIRVLEKHGLHQSSTARKMTHPGHFSFEADKY
eukprot:TRINITY_DN7231_c0_g1_i2.p2 TRINITY_DN7231_c0_g1~~TRINITY_DN7231_c0_g1_i2.p2  ORF type:complete len:103 (+),score=30.77 TRINITY_DN7231_c0_g1_i2:286-594(+)